MPLPQLLIRFALCAAAAVIAALLLAAAAAWALLDAKPLAQQHTALQPAALAQAHRWFQAVRGTPGVAAGGPVSLAAADADALLNDLAQRLVKGQAQVRLGHGQAEVTLSLPWARLPWPAGAAAGLQPLARWRPYLNLRATLHAQPAGIPALGTVWLGSLPVPGPLAAWAVAHGAAGHPLEAEARLALAAVRELGFTPAAATIRLQVDEAFKARARALLLPAGELQRLKAYHARLARLLPAAGASRAAGAPPPAVPLIDLLVPLMAVAADRSAAHGTGNVALAAAENRAALLALALCAAGVSPAVWAPDPAQWPALPPAEVVLHGRVDMAQHFLGSAVLAAGLGGRLADVLGVYKELADAGSLGTAAGGSGFSFNDLAADRAGVRYGQRALRDPLRLQARTLQARHDAHLMPAVADLPQYWSAAELRERVGELGSPRFQAYVRDIEQRVSEVAVLQ